MGSRLTYANVTATLALVIALGGTSYAAIKLPKNSVTSVQVKDKSLPFSLNMTFKKSNVDRSEVIVIGNQAPEFAKALARCRRNQIVIDLVRLPIMGSLLAAEYRGICW